MKSRNLLKKPDECEYPSEFLVARLLGKKGRLFRNWDTLIAGNDALQSLQNTSFYPFLKTYGTPGIWRFLRNEHMWVYKRMNNTLRSRFEPYFSYYEIGTLVVCLRYLAGRKEIEHISHELHASLLHDDIHKILTGGLDFAAMLQALELRLCTYSELFKGLSEHYEKNGLAALEICIRDSFFASVFSRKPDPRLKIFFQYLVDLHNSISMAKTLRWKIESEPTMIPGGTVPLERFKRAYLQSDLAPVLLFFRFRDMDWTASNLQELETTFLSFITWKLKSWAYQRTVIGDILFYLWEQYRYTRNISMILNTVSMDDETVRESVVV